MRKRLCEREREIEGEREEKGEKERGVGLFLWHLNHCGLFNDKFCSYIYIYIYMICKRIVCR